VRVLSGDLDALEAKLRGQEPPDRKEEHERQPEDHEAEHKHDGGMEFVVKVVHGTWHLAAFVFLGI